MKRNNIKNEKVIRAIAIGLATMITLTASPVTVLADETEGGNDTNTGSGESAGAGEETNESSVQESSGSEESSAEEISVSEASEACDEVQEIYEGTDSFAEESSSEETASGEAEEPAVSIPKAIDAAAAAVEAVPETIYADAAALEGIQADITAAAESVGNIIDTANEVNKIAEAKTALDNAATAENTAKNLETAAQTSLGTAEASLDDLSTKSVEATEDADSAISNADVANTSSSRTEAYQAKDDAEASLAEAEEGLKAVTEAYNNASADVIQAESELEAAKAAHDQAESELDTAKALLADTKTNATAANERLKAAQAKVDALDAKIGKLAENKEELEAIQQQYYAMMVQFFRLNNTGAIFYDNYESNKNARTEELIVNIEKTVKKIKEDTTKINQTATGSDKAYLGYGRYLTKLLVEQMILADKNVDPATANISFGIEDNDNKKKPDDMKGYEGTVFTNWSYQAQVTYTGDNDMYDYWHQKDNMTEKIETGKVVDMKWYQTNQDDAGRSNYVAVQYTDKDGNTQIKRYNFIRKNSGYLDKLDIENGMFFLAEVKKGEDGKYHYTRITNNDYNFDDYNKLLGALAAIEDLKEYNAAKKAVGEAADKVNKLTERIEALQNIKGVSREALETLQNKLEDAQVALEEAKTTKEALEEKVEETRKAVAGIDLSRFNIVPAEDTASDEDATDEDTTDEDTADEDTADTTPSPATTPSATVTPSAVTIDLPGLGISPIVLPAAPATGVLGVRTDGGTEADEGGVADSRTNVAPRANFSTVNKVLGSRQNKDNSKLVKKIKDNEIPLAEIPNMDDEVTMNWMWLLIIFLLGATGKKMYDEYKKKKEAEEAAKINK